MKIVLTGSSGFVGNYFIAHYADKYDISTFSFMKDELSDLDLSNTDAIIHLSALVHQMGGAQTEEYHRVNVENTLNLAQKAKENSIRHFIFMSSVKVYGEETNVPYTEKSECKPQDEYGKSKLVAEQKLMQLEDENFTVSIIRTPIVYGYGVKANIKNLISLVKKVPVLPFGKINNNRSMVYIGNLCHLIAIILDKQRNGVFLASDDKPLSTTGLIELIAYELDKNTTLLKIPFFETFLKQVKPSFHKRLYESLEVDNSQTKETLNFKNPFSTKEGVNLMINGENT
ncbi:MAG: epimerase [Sulfurovum sp.]|nr:MAG: epimerase [Sulfurovum sp.]